MADNSLDNLDPTASGAGQNGGESLDPQNNRPSGTSYNDNVTDNGLVTGNNVTPGYGSGVNTYNPNNNYNFNPVTNAGSVLDKGHLGLINFGNANNQDLPYGGTIYGKKFLDQKDRRVYGDLGTSANKQFNEILDSKLTTTNTNPVLQSAPLLGFTEEINGEMNTTIFIDNDSGKYLGHIEDYIETEKWISFPKLHVNVRAIERIDFMDVKAKHIKVNEVTTISAPIPVAFDTLIKNIGEMVNKQIKYDLQNSRSAEFMPFLEQSLYILYKYKENIITSCILPFERVNLINGAFSINVYSVDTTQKSCHIVTEENYKQSEDYFIHENKLTDPVSKLILRENIPNNLKYIYMDKNIGKEFSAKVEDLREYVICDCHTHPNQEAVDPNKGISTKPVDHRVYAEPSDLDMQASRQTQKPDLVLEFSATLDKTNSILSKIYIVTKKSTKPKKYTYEFTGKSTIEVLNKFKVNIEEILLNDIIKEYYEGPNQPK